MKYSESGWENTRPSKQNLDKITITTSHSFRKRDRYGVWGFLENSPIYQIDRRNDRRGVAHVDSNGSSLTVEFHIEMTADEHTDRFRERSQEVNTLRLKVTHRNCRGNSSKECAKTCLNALHKVEQTITGISSEESLSITYHYDDKVREEYHQERIDGFQISLFDHKLQVQHVPRDDLKQALEAVAAYQSRSLK
ncbi:hypothetical protein [Natrinema sp. 74]|uniref:hypothetical protein n=1 Tax=Natrinema sp. 74 TaxID=3384159 RepID=UPI0038D4B8D4